VVDKSVTMNNPQFGRKDNVMAEVDDYFMRDARQGLRNTPG
jgi:hypothetical protein